MKKKLLSYFLFMILLTGCTTNQKDIAGVTATSTQNLISQEEQKDPEASTLSFGTMTVSNKDLGTETIIPYEYDEKERNYRITALYFPENRGKLASVLFMTDKDSFYETYDETYEGFYTITYREAKEDEMDIFFDCLEEEQPKQKYIITDIIKEDQTAKLEEFFLNQNKKEYASGIQEEFSHAIPQDIQDNYVVYTKTDTERATNKTNYSLNGMRGQTIIREFPARKEYFLLDKSVVGEERYDMWKDGIDDAVVTYHSVQREEPYYEILKETKFYQTLDIDLTETYVYVITDIFSVKE